MDKKRIGLMMISDERKGLAHDAAVLKEALHGAAHLVPFPLEQLPPTEDPDGVRATGQTDLFDTGPIPHETFAQWLLRSKLDKMIFIEFIPRGCAALCEKHGVHCILIANLDWATFDYSDLGDGKEWRNWLRTKKIEVWAKTPGAQKTLEALGICARLGNWATHMFPKAPSLDMEELGGQPFVFLFNGGTLRDHKNRTRRNVECAIEAFKIAQTLTTFPIELDVKVVGTPQEYRWVHDLVDNNPDIRVQAEFLDHAGMEELYANCDAVLYPSRYEGFGLSCLEALNAGKPVLCTDGAPMNEIVTHMHDGIHVPATRVGRHALADVFEVDPSDLAHAMLQLIDDPRLLIRLTMPDQTERRAKHLCAMADIRHAATGKRLRALVIGPMVTPYKPTPSEAHWAQALEDIGMQVTYQRREDEPQCKREAEDAGYSFILTGKIRPELAYELRDRADAHRTPFVVWLHDWSRFTPERERDFKELEKAANVFLGADLNSKSRTVAWQGVSLWSDRGLGKRHTYRPVVPTTNDVVFAGNKYQTELGKRRNDFIEKLRAYGLLVYGDGWRGETFPVYGKEKADVYSKAAAVLSVSATNTEEFMTSNRLIDAVASGARVLAQSFPGLDLLIPAPAELLTFKTFGEGAQLIQEEQTRAPWLKFLGDPLQGEINAYVAYNFRSWRAAVGEVIAEINDYARIKRHSPGFSTEKVP